MSRRTKCLSNLRQLAISAIGYANDNKGHLPVECGNTGGTGGTDTSFWNAVPSAFRRDMYVYMGFTDPEPGSIPVTSVATPTANPIPNDAWECPSNPVFYINTSWSNSKMWWSRNVITSYAYYARGWYCRDNVGGKDWVWHSAPGAVEWGTGFFMHSGNKDLLMQPSRITDTDPNNPNGANAALPLFGDDIEYDPQGGSSNVTGVWNMNHTFQPGTTAANTMVTEGLNEVYTDGHGEWVTNPSSAVPQTLIPGVPGTGNSSMSNDSSSTYWGCWWWY